ncbi:MAG: hypothetical protein CMO81_00020 [Waddliaceae bacterium]|nr:hypothetical protein [Waddliaceae bacterium]
MLGDKGQTELFENHDKEFSEHFGIALSGRIERFGIDLSDTESRMIEAILHGFTLTSYKGNLESKPKEEILQESYEGKQPPTFKYIEQLPRLRATQSDILEWAGINKNSIAAKVRALEALTTLGRKQYCFFYDRLAFDENRMPMQDRHGKWKKEEVIAVDTLFTIKEVRDQGKGALQYYEIIPSPLFLDQRDSYFLLVPNNWREEVRTLYGNKKASSYTFRLLMFLRYQYEVKRRSTNISPPYEIRWSPKEIATAINMPSSVVERNRNRMNTLLEDAYEVSIRLGYLNSYERLGHLDILRLRDDKYYGSVNSVFNTCVQQQKPTEKQHSKEAEELFSKLHENKKKIDPKHTPPDGKDKESEVSTFDVLLSARSFNEIATLMDWGFSKKFWCTRVSTPQKILKNFSDAWIEMSLENSPVSQEDNKSWVSKILQDCVISNIQTKVEALNNYLEIVTGPHQPVCIEYNDKDFKEKVLKTFKRYKISIPSKI